MTYDELYPNAVELCFVEGDLLRASREQPCSQCQVLTHWIELDFQAYFCSKECVAKCSDEYLREIRLTGNQLD